MLIRGTPPPDVESLLTRAEALEPGDAFVQLARAAWAQHASDTESAQHALARSITTLRDRNWLGWIPVHDRWAKRWGLRRATIAEDDEARSQKATDEFGGGP